MKSLKKLRRQCKRLTYQVQVLELEQRLAELQQNQRPKTFGFYHEEEQYERDDRSKTTQIKSSIHTQGTSEDCSP
jgi:hypothetical protein